MRYLLLATALALATNTADAQCYNTVRHYNTGHVATNYAHVNHAYQIPIAVNSYQVLTPYSPVTLVDPLAVAAFRGAAYSQYASVPPAPAPTAQANQGFNETQLRQIATLINELQRQPAAAPAPSPNGNGGAKGVRVPVPVEGAKTPADWSAVALNLDDDDLASVNNPAFVPVRGVRAGFAPVARGFNIANNALNFAFGVPRAGFYRPGFGVGGFGSGFYGNGFTNAGFGYNVNAFRFARPVRVPVAVPYPVQVPVAAGFAAGGCNNAAALGFAAGGCNHAAGFAANGVCPCCNGTGQVNAAVRAAMGLGY